MAVVGGRTVWLAVGSIVATIGYAVVLRRESVRVDERRRRARQLARRRLRQAEQAVLAAEAERARRQPQTPPLRHVVTAADEEFDETQWRRVVGQ